MANPAILPGSAAFIDYGQREVHVRLVTEHIRNDEFGVWSPDYDFFVEQLSSQNPDIQAIRFSDSVTTVPRGVPGRGNMLYTFDNLTAAVQAELLKEAVVLCDQERAALGLPRAGMAAGPGGAPPGNAAATAAPVPAAGVARVAGANGAWVLSEPIGDHEVGAEFILPLGGMSMGDRALVTIDGKVAALSHVAAGVDLDTWGLERRNQLADDPRLLPRSKSLAIKPFRECIDMCVKCDRATEFLPPTPITGPFVPDEWFSAMVDKGVISLVDRSNRWSQGSGVRHNSPIRHEHLVIHRALQLFLTVDLLNVRNLAGVDYLLKRVQLQESAVQENPESPSYEGAELFMGVDEAPGGAFVAPSVSKHVAAEMAAKSAILKEKRKAREARAPNATPTPAGADSQKKPGDKK